MADHELSTPEENSAVVNAETPSASEEHQRGNRMVTNPKTVHKNDSSKP
jgi:hypothetical protein